MERGRCRCGWLWQRHLRLIRHDGDIHASHSCIHLILNTRPCPCLEHSERHFWVSHVHGECNWVIREGRNWVYGGCNWVIPTPLARGCHRHLSKTTARQPPHNCHRGKTTPPYGSCLPPMVITVELLKLGYNINRVLSMTDCLILDLTEKPLIMP